MTVPPDSGRPLVSVILPVHAAEDLVVDAIERTRSLRASGAIEVIVVDDASPDATADRAASAAEGRTDVRVVRRAERGGPTLARRTGYAVARGTWAWHADVDDEWSDEIVARLLEAARGADADLVACRATRVERNGRSWTMEGVDGPTTVDADGAVGLVADGTIRGHLWNKLIRLDLLRADEHEPLRTHDDTLVVLHAVRGSRVVVLLPDLLYRYLEHPGSVSSASLASMEDLARVAEAARELLQGSADRASMRRWDLFESWFLLLPALTTPAHEGWPRSERDALRRRHGPALTWRRIGLLLHGVGVRPAALAAAAKATGPAFGSLYRAVGRSLGWSINRSTRK